jgi:hypothetical protein
MKQEREMQLTKRQGVYAALSLVGLCATWYFNLRFMQAHGAGLGAFIQAGYANAAAASLANDVTVGAITFLVWSYAESRKLGMKHWWVWPVLTCGIAFAFAFPLFLLQRDRVLRRQG